ncbi:hypothetical protein [Bradyrhizobium sp. ORS 86]|uniref:hypothetical protein n=1 Tax=Bradyrhizobium sp. ORS 86 TaxID=1685970 RepID=UPI00388F646C
MVVMMPRMALNIEEKELILMLREWKREVGGFGWSAVHIIRQDGRGWEVKFKFAVGGARCGTGQSFSSAWNALRPE